MRRAWKIRRTRQNCRPALQSKMIGIVNNRSCPVADDSTQFEHGDNMRSMHAASAQKEKSAKSRRVLSSFMVTAIFKRSMPNKIHEHTGAALLKRESAVAVAKEYGVSEKTIRDIWTGRSWLHHV